MMHEQLYKELVITQAQLEVVDRKEAKAIAIKCLIDVSEP